MSSSNIQNPLDFSCYYDESSDEYHIPKGEHDELVESHTRLQKSYDITHSDDGWMNPTADRCYEELKEELQQYKDTLEEHFHHYELLKAKNEKLKEQVKYLTLDASRKDEKNAELIAEKLKLDDEANKLTEEVEEERKISFWRMCESYNGFNKNTNLHDPEWIAEMNAMIEDKFDPEVFRDSWTVTVEELQAGYSEWVDYNPDDEDESEDEGYQHSEEGDGFPRD